MWTVKVRSARHGESEVRGETPVARLVRWTVIAMASLDRISEVLALKPNMPQLPPEPAPAGSPGAVVAFQDVSFSYPGGQEVLHHVTFALERGKT